MSAAIAAPCSRSARARPQARPRIAVLLGSGWGGLTRQLADAQRIPYAELPAFPRAGVAGHAGELWLGRLGAREVAVLSGRSHAYEDGDADGMKARAAHAARAGLRGAGADQRRRQPGPGMPRRAA